MYIKKCERKAWRKFSKYHYLSSEISNASQCYGVFDDNGFQVAFIGVIHYPHPHNDKIKKVTRLVVLPDYQGMGIGKKLLNVIGDLYLNKGFDFGISTSSYSLKQSLIKDKDWYLKSNEIKKRVPKAKIAKNVRKVKVASFYKKRGAT